LGGYVHFSAPFYPYLGTALLPWWHFSAKVFHRILHILFAIFISVFSTGQKPYRFLHKCHRMSANDGISESYYRAEFLHSFSPGTKGSSPGMELSPSRYQSPQQVNETLAESSNMSTLTMGRPPPMFPSPNVMIWEERRPLELPSRPRSPPESVELPSIRQVCSGCCC
jgi:hypothetical protein